MSDSRGLKILQIVSSSATSGAERHVLSLSELLQSRGHTVEVVCPEGGWLAEDLRKKGIAAHTTHMKGSGWLRTCGYVTKLVRTQKFDVVHTHLTRATYFGYVTGLMRRKPIVATVHIANHDPIYKKIARGPNRLVAVSDFVRGMLHGRGIPDKFIDTVYNGTDFFEFERTQPREVFNEFGIPQEKKLIGLVGRVCREKGHLMLVEAMKDVKKKHPDAHLMFVGRVMATFDPVVNKAIEDASLRDSITMTGIRNDIPRLLDAFQFSTMPSHIETFGIAAIEAMARNKAVVATRVGGLPEIVKHGQTGLLIDLRPDELAEAVNYLLDNEDEREQMGALGRQIAEEKFTLRQMGDRLEKVYRRASGVS